jgi:hypothetical protein
MLHGRWCKSVQTFERHTDISIDKFRSKNEILCKDETSGIFTIWRIQIQGYLVASHRRDLGSIIGQSVWCFLCVESASRIDFLATTSVSPVNVFQGRFTRDLFSKKKWHWDRVFSEFFSAIYTYFMHLSKRLYKFSNRLRSYVKGFSVPLHSWRSTGKKTTFTKVFLFPCVAPSTFWFNT